MDRAVVLVGEAGVEERPRIEASTSAAAARQDTPVIALSRTGEFLGAGAEVLGDVIEDLSAVVCGRRAPGGRLGRGLDRVADVLAAAEGASPTWRPFPSSTA